MKRILWAALLGLLGVGLVRVAERVILVHSSPYPAWLATGTINTLVPGSMAQLRAKSCGGNQLVEVFENSQQLILRCGDWWPASKTWVVPRTPGNTVILHDPAAF